MSLHRFLIPLLWAGTLSAQAPVEVVRVVSKAVERQAKLPGEFRPYLGVPVHAKVTGFVEKVEVDRGSVVKKDQVLAILVAPEMKAQIAEAQSKAQAIELQRAEAEAKLAAAESTYERLKAASATPGVIAGNDLIVAEKGVEAAQAMVRSYEGSLKAAEASVKSLQELERYLTITAPFDGVIVERDVHPGALVGPSSAPLLKLEQVTRLRLVVAVPEALVGGIVKGARVSFTLPALPGETFQGVVSRIAHSLDEKTRTMAVELDVSNPGMRLAPGMYPEVLWPVRKPRPSLLVPPTSIVTTTERTFVIRVRDDVAEWVTVTRGAAVRDLVEVYGPLQDGELVVRRGSDELREGTRVKAQVSIK
jgi:membrane fusion protein, multidrug efflux system